MSARLEIVDARSLPREICALLRPGEAMEDAAGRTHFLPRHFYVVPTWAAAQKMPLTAHFTMAEMMTVDSREADLLLNTFPHHVPCAVAVFARYLEVFRERVEAPVYLATNGGYRSPSHAHARGASPHHWATAANIYRIGDTYLDDLKTIEKYARIAGSIGEEVHTKPFGHGPEESDDHLHLDIGYVMRVPAECDET